MQKKFSIIALIAALACMAIMPAVANAATTWRFALEETEGSVQDAFAQKFKQEIEKASNGEINLEIYFGGQLGTSDQITELVQDGAIELAMQSPGHLGSFIPEVQIFSIHFLLPGEEDKIRKLLAESKAFNEILASQYEKNNMELLSIFPEGWQVWTLKKEVRKPEDFKGLKMRVMTSPLLVEAYKAYGADPTPMPYAEVYSGLQLNMIQGQVNPLFWIYQSKFFEVTDYLIFPRHLMYYCTFASSKAFADGLDAKTAEMVKAAAKVAYEHTFDVQKAFDDEYLGKITEAKPDYNVINLTDAELAPFKAKAEMARKKYLEIGGEKAADILNTLEAEIKALN